MSGDSRGLAEAVASMSHDLRAPLNTIMGFSELMHGGRAGPIADDHREYLGDILASARLLLRMLNDVIDLAKAEAGRLEFFPEPVNLAELMTDVTTLAADSASERGVALRVDIDPALAAITIDPDKLKQIVRIYVAHMLASARSGAVITVRAKPEGASSFRLDVERDGAGAGSGDDVGLLLAKRLVELMRGRSGGASDERASRFFAILPQTADQPHA